MIHIYFTRFIQPLPRAAFERCMALVGDTDRHKIRRFRRWQDAHASLFGRLLLREGLQSLFQRRWDPDEFLFTQYHKPYLNGNISFNIAHSGEFVICAISDESQVGIDVERVRALELSDFSKYMTDDQWRRIYNALDPLAEFFRFWAMKEAVMKADGRGMYIPLLSIVDSSDSVVLNGVAWRLFDFTLDRAYAFCLASNSKALQVQLHYCDFTAL